MVEFFTQNYSYNINKKMNLHIEKWIISEFCKKYKKDQVRVGSAYQANIPDLICEKCSLNSAKENEMKTTSIYF